MILQALVDYYEALAAQDDTVPRPGWEPVKVSFAVCLNDDGAVEQIIDIKTEQQSGKKTAILPQKIQLPACGVRTAGIKARFLGDNSGYIFGVSNKDKPQRSLQCFAAAKELHQRLLSEVDSPAARAVCSFFAKWQPEQAKEHPALQENRDELIGGANMIFYYRDKFVQDVPEIRRIWQEFYNDEGEDAKEICLVTGEPAAVAAVHPSIKGVIGAQSSGAALVSFNADSFCSYGREQSNNAPCGKYAAFAYTTALNHLLAEKETVYRIGDCTVLFWAQNGQNAYKSLFNKTLYDEQSIRDIVKSLCMGHSVDFEETSLDSDMQFYVLGISPNAARLSVRFFLHNSFGKILQNVQAHYDRLEIDRPAYEKSAGLPLWRLLNETVNQKSSDKKPAPNMAGDTMRAILTDGLYPATLINGVNLRIRAEHEVTYGRAAIIKAFYTKNNNINVPKEVLTVSLNEESKNVPYVLGRLFAVLERIQEKANPGINTTIKDKYFDSASGTPAGIFPVLISLAHKHLRKLDTGLRIYFEKQIGEIDDILPENLPANLNLPQQGSFQIGYYHQRQRFFQKKEEN